MKTYKITIESCGINLGRITRYITQSATMGAASRKVLRYARRLTGEKLRVIKIKEIDAPTVP